MKILAVAERADFGPAYNGEDFVTLTFRVPKDTEAMAGRFEMKVYGLLPKRSPRIICNERCVAYMKSLRGEHRNNAPMIFSRRNSQDRSAACFGKLLMRSLMQSPSSFANESENRKCDMNANLRDLIVAYDEYVQLCGEYEGQILGLAFAHGYRGDLRLAQRALELRAKITKLRSLAALGRAPWIPTDE